MTQIMYFPVVETETQLIDILSRAAWFLGFCSIERISIPIASKDLSRIQWRVAPGMDSSIEAKLVRIRSAVEFVVATSEDELAPYMSTASIILHWKKDALPQFVSPKTLSDWKKGKKVWEVDHKMDRMEGARYIEADLFLTGNKQALIEENSVRFSLICKRLGKFERAFLLATGPSVSEYKAHDFTNAITIACNSTVLDHDLMTITRPQIITFADPIFHFGPSEYASEFRRQLIIASKLFDFDICIPFKYYPLFTSTMPELKHRTVGIPFRQDILYSFDLDNNFIVKTTANILTLMMLPLATTFAKNIFFLGFDGRPLSDNNYFWKHNPKTQINDKMENIQEIHPGFFKLDYNDYYLQHCNILEDMLDQGEKLGYSFSSLAFSHIPALNKRIKEQELFKIHSAKADVFDFDKELQSKKSFHYPRLLIIDSTPLGSLSATGQLKETFLGDWPRDRVLQVYNSPSPKPLFHGYHLNVLSDTVRKLSLSKKEVLNACKEFSPDVIYYRPVNSPELMDFAQNAVTALQRPLVIHIMDDWQERLRIEQPDFFGQMDARLRHFILIATERLSICDAMSNEYQIRYGHKFKPLANGIDINEFQGKNWGARPTVNAENPFIIRYAGALTDDMGFQSICDIAECINELQDVIPIKFEIYTMNWCRKKAEEGLGSFPNVNIYDSVVGVKAYRSLLQTADALVVAYNFDNNSERYTRLSMANKMPECLASGVPLLAYGPRSVATIDYLAKSGVAVVVTKRDKDLLKQEILSFATTIGKCAELSKKARHFVAKHHSRASVQEKFYTTLYNASLQDNHLHNHILDGPHTRDSAAHYDETDCIACLFSTVLIGKTMIDVGAHHGSALMPFLNMNWHIYAFEPDNKNRVKLLERLFNHKFASNVQVDLRAVSNNRSCGLNFYCSDESTGISSLSAFHDTHKCDQRVDVTTLSEFLADKNIAQVDFLKIDTEGHDFFVLQGFPWERFKPAVIECEFEDTKTVTLGYTFYDMAGFLAGKGYQVYVSEWHPIVRYGIRHNWKCLMRYPCQLTDEKAWGNLLAFRDSIDDAVVVEAVKKELKFYGADGSATKTIPDLQAGLANSGFKFKGIFYNGKVFQKHDSYKLQPPSGKNWVVCKYKGNVQAGDTVAGNVIFCVDTDCKLKLMLCRDGNTSFESSVKTLSLTKGQHSMTLSHQFKKAHQGARIQIGVEDKKVKISDIKSELKLEQQKQSELPPVKRKPVPKNINTPKVQKITGSSAQKKKPEVVQFEKYLFVVGNGSSLRDMEFQRLQACNSIGMNAACRHWRTTGIYPNYYICLDTVVIISLKDEIYELIQKRNENGVQLFFLRKNLLNFYPELKNIPEVLFFEDYFKSPYFEGLTNKTTTGSFAALLGAMLGYKQIYLLGIDLNYVQQISEAKKVEGHVLEMTRTPAKNPNYFFNDYQRKGDRFHVPDAIPNLHYQSWIMVKERLERFGVHVLNCNPKSRLDIFNYADINDVLSC